MLASRETKIERSPVIENFQEVIVKEFKKVVDEETAQQISNYLITKLDDLTPETDSEMNTQQLKSFMESVDFLTMQILLKNAKESKSTLEKLLSIQATIFKLRSTVDISDRILNKHNDLFAGLEILSSFTHFSGRDLKDMASNLVDVYTSSIKTVTIPDPKTAEKEKIVNQLASLLGSIKDSKEENTVKNSLQLLTAVMEPAEEHEAEFLSGDIIAKIKEIVLDDIQLAKVANNIASAVNTQLKVLSHDHDAIDTFWNKPETSPEPIKQREILIDLVRAAKSPVATLPTLKNSSTMFGASTTIEKDIQVQEKFFPRTP